MSSDPPLNFRVLEEKFQTALPKLDKVLGRHDPDTIDCARTLGNIYLEQEKYSEAQATFEGLHRGQVTEFGELTTGRFGHFPILQKHSPIAGIMSRLVNLSGQLIYMKALWTKENTSTG
jgi:hypothetical protein